MNVIKLIDGLGGTSAVAELCGVKAPSVSDWKRVGRIPDDKLIRLAPIAESRGVSTRKELFPDDWQDIWPELAAASAATAPAAIHTVTEEAKAAIRDLEKDAEAILEHLAEDAKGEIRHLAEEMLASVRRPDFVATPEQRAALAQALAEAVEPVLLLPARLDAPQQPEGGAGQGD